MPRPPKFTPADLQWIADHATQIPAYTMAKTLGVSPSAVQWRMKQMGITPCGKSNYTNRVNLDLFSPITVPEVAYFLGYAWADASVQTYCLDIQLLEADGHALYETTHKYLPLRKQASLREGKYLRMAVNDVAFIRFVKERFNMHNKSLESPIGLLRVLSPSVLAHFLRGFIDGDGSIDPNGMLTLSGHKDLDWSWFTEICAQHGVECRLSVRQGEHAASIVCPRYKADGLRLMQWVYETYPKDLIGLPRKWERFNANHQAHQRRIDDMLNRYTHIAETMSMPLQQVATDIGSTRHGVCAIRRRINEGDIPALIADRWLARPPSARFSKPTTRRLAVNAGVLGTVNSFETPA